MNILLYTITLWLYIYCPLNRAQIPAEFQNIDKFFTNGFKVKLRSNPDLDGSLDSFAKEGFTYERPIISTFHLFRKEGVRNYSLEAYNVTLLEQLQARLSNVVEFVEQDYERRVVPKSELNVLGTPNNGADDSVRLGGVPESKTVGGEDGSIIRVAVADARIQIDHPNLVHAVDRELCYDFIDNDRDPSVDLDREDVSRFYNIMSHGTQCMGRIGATADHGCDQGVAPNVKLVGLRMITDNGSLSDEREGRALSYKLNEIDVFSCSYGIIDNHGFYKPGSVATEALKMGVEKGRDCRGRIFVFPSGNGHIDNCNADGYAKSIDTVTIANVDRNGRLPSNTEICPCALAATFGKGFRTTYLYGRCTDTFDGASASTAVAAGYIGEMLTVYPLLSKRDVEHIIVKTASREGLDPSIHWRRNGAGLLFNDQIGFGRMDLNKMKQSASNWSFVPEAHVCVIMGPGMLEKQITIRRTLINSNGCYNTSDFVGYLEKVQVELHLNCSNIAEVAVQLISPMNTSSPILTKMNMSKNVTEKFKILQWTFMSVQFWGEKSDGIWTVEVRVEDATVECTFSVKQMIFHGTEGKPEIGGRHMQCHKEDSSKLPTTKEPESRANTVIQHYRQQFNDPTFIATFIVGIILFIGLGSIIVFVLKFCQDREVPCRSNRKLST